MESDDVPRTPTPGDDADRDDPTRGAEQLGDVLDAAEHLGFGAQVLVEEARPGMLRCGNCNEVSAAEEFARDWTRRLEGASDPDDMLHVSALRCPRCGSGGVLVCHYGPEASAAEAEVLRQLRPT